MCHRVGQSLLGPRPPCLATPHCAWSRAGLGSPQEAARRRVWDMGRSRLGARLGGA